VKPNDRRASSDRQLAAALSRWFARSARDLPWRTAPRDPYRSLLSEVMLQQTQVSRVVELFPRFIARFPNVEALAAAPEADVLALWSGLGYYSRARNLHAAARQIVADFGGRIPDSVADLRTLKGVGRYTAGAIASIVYARSEPIVDGNVARVLLRLHGKPLAHAGPEALAWSWRRAGELVAIARNPAAFNEGLMELGATVCTPRNPGCGRCPLRARCTANAKGLQHRIPRPKRPAARTRIHCSTVILTDARGQLLLERRPAKGMWAGLWQAPTLEATSEPPLLQIKQWLGVRKLDPAGAFTHQTSHREVRFTVYRAHFPTRSARLLASRSLVARDDLATIGLGSAQRRAILIGLDHRP
jgi:A/G-specific adenine glycosylase